MSSRKQEANNESGNYKLDLINKARSVLRGDRNRSAEELKKLYEELEHHDQFAYATEVLLVKMNMEEDNGVLVPLKEFQKLATYIYKDHSLPSSFKFEKALKELSSHDDLIRTNNCETLGLVGAIYKRKWQFDHQFKNLMLSMHYYKRGYDVWANYIKNIKPGAGKGKEQDVRDDDGYTAINYAYVNDLMAIDRLEEYGNLTGLNENIGNQLKEAEDARKFIIEQFVTVTDKGPALKGSNYPGWVLSTIAEAYFGLQQYDIALQFIQQYLKLEGSRNWEIKTFSKQLFSIAYLQRYLLRFKTDEDPTDDDPTTRKVKSVIAKLDDEKINQCLSELANAGSSDGNKKHPEVIKAGKTGIALSGGGFRASLFHIGVLAGLAEKDQLRFIEVISCVSGGSIIGAYYYLKLKQLLERKADEEIVREDYIELVKEIEVDFLKGVQKNLRIRVFSNLWCNIKMLQVKKYSRTHRIGELYEEHLYNQLWEKDPAYKEKLKSNGGTIFMSDLFIYPKDRPVFNISEDNWQRRNKVPQLVLNATSVNTGHNWQFTASWMGEPPGNIQADIDVKPRLRRLYYGEAPEERFRKFRLGYAVGASSCVPVMFHPMPMHGLYEEVDLQLIDGGLHDNQGIAALIEQECKNIIISDASGQMPTNNVATTNILAVFYRADNILQERLRELQFMDIKERNYTTQINALLTVHLKKDLQENPVSWKYCTDPPRSIVYANLSTDNTDLTKYGVLWNVQAQLSEIRTDLDSFSDVEAKGLMYSGYAQINYEYAKVKGGAADEGSIKWKFLDIEEYVTLPEKAEKIKLQLDTAKKLAFKVVDLSWTVKVVCILLGALAAAGLLYLGYKFWDETVLTITVKILVYSFIIFLIGLVSKVVASLINYKTTFRRYAAFVIVMCFAWIFCNIYLAIFNIIYNNAGKIPAKK
ncbi:MAG: patatin-like phospholipase family protein [Chitinophagaceae bacterium]